MKKRIFYPLFCCCAFLSVPLMAQQSPLLEKYRMMALDYNHDLKAAEKNIAASVEIEKSAKADLKPKLSGAANFQYTGNPLELTLDVPSIGLSKTVEGKQLNYEALFLSCNRFIRADVYWNLSVWRNINNHWQAIRRRY